MQPNEKRILNALKKAKGKGVKELTLVGDIKPSYATKIKSQINKKLGDKAVYTDLGVWYLQRDYWETPMLEFRDIIIIAELKKVRSFITWSIGIALTVTLFIGIILGLTVEIFYV